MKWECARRAHAWLLLTLGLFLVFHAWEHWPVRSGRDALLARLERTSSLPLEVAFVLLPMLGLVVTAIFRWRVPVAPGSYPSAAFRRLALASGVVGGAFTLLHVATVWGQRLLHGGQSAAGYAAMVDQAGQLPVVALYVVGSAAVCVYWAEETAAAWLSASPGHAVRAAWGVAALLGTLLWLILVDELSAYAAGRALL